LYEIKVAKKLKEGNLFSAASFHAHQACEMAYKVLYHEMYGNIQTHDLVFMAKRLKAPSLILKLSGNLNPVYQETRYPDIHSSSPSEHYTADDTTEDINNADEVLNWIEKKLS
jgi:HEPN domain-containing protein